MNNFVKIEIIDGIPSLSMEYEDLEKFKVLMLSVLSPYSHEMLHEVIYSMLKEKDLQDELSVVNIIESAFQVANKFSNETSRNIQVTCPSLFK